MNWLSLLIDSDADFRLIRTDFQTMWCVASLSIHTMPKVALFARFNSFRIFVFASFSSYVHSDARRCVPFGEYHLSMGSQYMRVGRWQRRDISYIRTQQCVLRFDISNSTAKFRSSLRVRFSSQIFSCFRFFFFSVKVDCWTHTKQWMRNIMNNLWMFFLGAFFFLLL